MKSKMVILIFVVISVVAMIIYPNILIDTGEKLIACRYSDDISEFDQNQTYNENYSYYEEKDVSISNYDIKNFLCFYIIEMEYVKGDMREEEFVLQEEYITRFLTEAKIVENESNIDLAKLIDGKTPIVGNTRYTGNDYEQAIYYVLDEREEELYVFYVDDLLVIQVGSPDESPKYIAYR